MKRRFILLAIGLMTCLGAILAISSRNKTPDSGPRDTEKLTVESSRPQNRDPEKTDHHRSENRYTQGSEDLDVSSYISEIKAERDQGNRELMLEILVGSYGKSHAREVYDFLKTYDPAESARGHISRLAGDCSSNDIDLTIEILQDFAPGDDRRDLIHGIFNQGADKMHHICNHLSKAKPIFKEDLDYIENYFYHHGFRTAENASFYYDLCNGFYQNVPDPEMAKRVAFSQASFMGRLKEPIQNITDLTRNIPEPAREIFASTYYKNYFERNELLPSVEEVVGAGMPDEYKAKFLQKIASHRIGSDGFGNTRELASNLSPADHEVFLSRAASTFIEKDSLFASKEIGKMPPSVDRDISVRSLVQFCLNKGELDNASLWAAQINNSQKRQEAMSLIEAKKTPSPN